MLNPASRAHVANSGWLKMARVQHASTRESGAGATRRENRGEDKAGHVLFSGWLSEFLST